ncbi:MAG: hypothetical protein EA355_00535 [Rhodobacteraceae bacterium]|nr:MAG: hypothetical protein EA355_00535 [Paracoccaceae bacterium]
MDTSTLGLASFAALVTAAAVGDVLTMRIANGLVLAMVGGWAILAPLAGAGPTEMGLAALAALLVLAGSLVLFSRGWIGGGDGKFAAACALWVGWAATPLFLLCASFAGGALALGVIAFRRAPLPVWALERTWIRRLRTAEKGAPYGVALAAGALAAISASPWMTGGF